MTTSKFAIPKKIGLSISCLERLATKVYHHTAGGVATGVTTVAGEGCGTGLEFSVVFTPM